MFIRVYIFEKTASNPVAISIIRPSWRSINLYEPHVPRGNPGGLPSVANKNLW